MARIFREFTKKYRRQLENLDPTRDHYGVIREQDSNINVGFVLRPGVGISGYEQDIMLQTIMRKENFVTRNRIYDV
jgi:hypothetical protein